MRALRASLCLALLLSGREWAWAREQGADGHTLLRRGIAQHRESAWAASVATLEQARQQGGLDAGELAECSFYLGAGYLALGSAQAARREVRAALEAQPGYELPQYTSPKVAALFREVQGELERLPRLRPLPPRRKSPKVVQIAFEASRTQGSAFGAAYWRLRGETHWREAPLGHAGDQLVAALELEHDGTVEYWAEIRAPAGAATAGAAAHPLELPVSGIPVKTVVLPPPPPPKTPIARRWWPWTILGGVAAAGLGVGLYFALRPPPTADAVLTLGVQ